MLFDATTARLLETRGRPNATPDRCLLAIGEAIGRVHAWLRSEAGRGRLSRFWLVSLLSAARRLLSLPRNAGRGRIRPGEPGGRIAHDRAHASPAVAAARQEGLRLEPKNFDGRAPLTLLAAACGPIRNPRRDGPDRAPLEPGRSAHAGRRPRGDEFPVTLS